MESPRKHAVQLCPKCLFQGEVAFEECPRCGIVVRKFNHLLSRAESTDPDPSGTDDVSIAEFDGAADSLLGRVLKIPLNRIGPVGFIGRSVFWVILLIWGAVLILSSVSSNAVGESVLHLVNLPFHEAGHLIFSPFGRLIASLGGTLGQLLVPLACLFVFFFKNRDNFASAVCLWWLGENFLDIAPYINDARAGALPLLGGNTGQTAPYGFHDWQFILGELNLLEYDHSLAGLSGMAGGAIMLVSLAWSGLLLYRVYRAGLLTEKLSRNL